MNILGIQIDLGSFFAGVGSTIVATGVVSLLFAILIRKLILGDMVLNYLASHADDLVDQVQKKDAVTGKALRERLIILAEKIIKELKAPNGTN